MSRLRMQSNVRLKLYNYYHEHGVYCLCTYCGTRDFCICDIRNLNAECFQCACRRLEREQRGSKLDVADFCRL